MPLYKSRKLKKKQETERRVRHRLTRDRRKLMLWAVQGPPPDYDRLRSGAVEFCARQARVHPQRRAEQA